MNFLRHFNSTTGGEMTNVIFQNKTMILTRGLCYSGSNSGREINMIKIHYKKNSIEKEKTHI